MITEFLIRLFIKCDLSNSKDEAVRSQFWILGGWVSFIINLMLFIIKLVSAIAINSISLMADAINSLSDIFSSAVVIWGAKMAAIPPDRDHPFGHGRVEHIATLIITICLIVTGFEFFEIALGRIRHPEPIIYNQTVIFIVLFTIVIKEWLARFSREVGRRIDSKVLMRDFFHNRLDVLTSSLVLVALFSEKKLHMVQFDGIVGILISGYLMYTGWQMLRDAIPPLIGESASYDELLQIKSIAMAAKGVKGVHDITMHKYGKVKIISLHVELPDDISFIEGHAIIEEIEEMINASMNATTIIHLDPVQKLDSNLSNVRSTLDDIIKSNPNIESYHDLRLVKVKEEPTLIFDIVLLDGTTSAQIDELRHKITSLLKLSFPEHTIKIWVDPKNLD